jgi:Dna[CI] antecedent, DciA
MIDAALLLPKILAQTGDQAEMKEVAAKIAWTRAAGPGLRRHAAPFRLYRKTLVVSVADAIWQKQLHAMSPELIFRMNKLLRRELIETIEFRIDPAALRNLQAGVSKVQHAKSNEPLPAELAAAADGISDPELRQRFIRAAANCIERQESRARNLTGV